MDRLLKRQKPALSSSSHQINNEMDPGLRPPARLCEKCQGIFDAWEQLKERDQTAIEHHENKLALRSSAEDGCGLCSHFILGGSLPTFWPGDDEPASIKGIVFIEKSKNNSTLSDYYL
jgi:hypothetical protein